MTSTTTKTAIRNTSALVSVSGKGKTQREMAFMKIAPLSFVETLSRNDTIDNLRVALGAAPTEDQTSIARREHVIGRVAARLPAGEFPKAKLESAEKLEFARDLVCSYAAPPKEGTTPRKLRAGQKGRRSAIQHKVIRAAEEACSLVFAELGLGAARTQAEKNAKQQRNAAPSMPGAKAGTKGQPSKADSAKPTHSELVKAPAPVTPEDAVQHVVTQAASLLAYANKNAKLLPLGFSEAVLAFKTMVNDAANEHALVLAARAAKPSK